MHLYIFQDKQSEITNLGKANGRSIFSPPVKDRSGKLGGLGIYRTILLAQFLMLEKLSSEAEQRRSKRDLQNFLRLELFYMVLGIPNMDHT